MPSMKSLLLLSVATLSIGWNGVCALAEPNEAVDSVTIHGEPLRYWVTQASADEGPEDLEKTVTALSSAVQNDNPKIKVRAADALAVLGPRAKVALPALLAQFAHEFPWVRVSCQAACGSMGEVAVPALIEKVEQSTGGPRIRAAYVLGGIGNDAKLAVPVIVRIMKDESPVRQVRYRGILSQIDPDRFDVAGTVATGAPFDSADARSTVEIDSGDWPQFHGPARDSVSREQGLLQEWPEDGPRLIWTLEGLGRGYSAVSIYQGTIFTMGDRATGGEEAQFVVAYDLNNRKELWARRVGPPHWDGGPRCTPTVDGGRVYAIGTDGDLVCLDAVTGDVRWRRNFVEDFEGQFMSVWKFSESPLVDGDQVLCTPGGPKATMVALNKHNGDLIWKCAIPDLGGRGADGAGYSSAVVAEIDGVRQYVQFVGRGVIGVEAATGRFLWGYNRIANNTANIASPAVRGNYVFASSSYNTGSALLRISRNAESFQADEVYFIHSRNFQNHHGGVVVVGDYIYGGHGQNRGDPACVALATGEVMWKERARARGSASVVYADNHVIFRYDRGEVLLVEASPESLKIKGRFKALDDVGPAWAHPVIHQGKLYLRHANQLSCYDLRAL
jgi:outer membrane protein assembly factor BamB